LREVVNLYLLHNNIDTVVGATNLIVPFVDSMIALSIIIVLEVMVMLIDGGSYGCCSGVDASAVVAVVDGRNGGADNVMIMLMHKYKGRLLLSKYKLNRNPIIGFVSDTVCLLY